MNPIFQIVIIAYLFLLVPFLTGVLEASIFRKGKKSASEIFANGYVLMLAVFCVLAVIFVQMKQPLSMLAKLWLAVTVVLCVLAVFVGRGVMKTLAVELQLFWRNPSRGKWIMLVVMLLSVIVSIGFTRPDARDATVEIVRISTETDSMYLYDAYSGYPTGYLDASRAQSPIEMFYAVGASLTGMEGSRLVYSVLPVSILLLFFSVMWRLARGLFEKDMHRIGFILSVILLYWMATYMEGRSLLLGIFVNGWNGMTFLECILLPLALSICLVWMKQAEDGVRKLPSKIEKLVLAAGLILAGQLLHNKGGFYVLLMLFLCVAVILIKGGYAYGIAYGGSKKRI